MNRILPLLHGHYITAGWVLAALANFVFLRMPPPDAQSGKAYQWAFSVLHGATGAFPRIAANFLPQTSWLYGLIAGGNGAGAAPSVTTPSQKTPS